MRESPLSQRQEKQLLLELKFAEKNRIFVTQKAAEVFVSNLPEFAQPVVEIVPEGTK